MWKLNAQPENRTMAKHDKTDMKEGITEQIPDVFIEGNIGAGKSTLLRTLQDHGVKTVQEPVEQWQDQQGYNFLQLLSDDGQKWAFPFQVLALTTVWKNYTNHAATPGVYERSVLSTVETFSKIHLQLGNLQQEHFAVLECLLGTLAQQQNRPHQYVYLRTQPEVAFQRVGTRGREEEKKIPLEYLQLLHQELDRWLLPSTNTNVTVIDGNGTSDNTSAQVLRTLRCLGYDINQ